MVDPALGGDPVSDPADRLRFYAERDRRAIQYDDALARVVERPIGVRVGSDAVTSRAGQVATLALVNMLSRLHRDVALAIPEAPLLASALVPGSSLPGVALATMATVDPFGHFSLVQPGAMHGRVVVGIGSMNAADDVTIGWTGLVATLGNGSQPVDHDDGSILGAALASCLGAAAVLNLVSGRTVEACTSSLVDFSESPNFDRGRSRLEPLDLGTVLLVGAGAVGSAVCYWLREVGIRGRWIVVDRDDLLLHNTNRTIGSLVEQTEWDGRAPAPKAEVAARLIGAEWDRSWYHEFRKAHPEVAPDVIIPVANDHNVRALVGMASRHIVHATTSQDWAAELHRHIAGVDECIACRFPADVAQARFACSTAPLVADSTTGDAALPFLSAAAGLMLVRGLQLHQEGSLPGLDANFVRLGLGSFRPGLGRFRRLTAPARDGCRHLPQAFLPPTYGAIRTI